ncbi:alpha/beta fold hydrolase [Algiphilus sp.]|uniref:alpha/beta hydrolase family protein n=1 Tax=Algiphilus sp. TaxID=1872431 RepID=UPI003B5221CE
MTNIQQVRIDIPARDGELLTGTHYVPASPSGTWLILSCAMAVPQRFYRHFAAHLAGRGHNVVTYDYRGIGASRRGPVRGMATTTSDWALLDMAGVVDWVHRAQRASRILLIGHSLGGQMAGLLDNAHHVDGMVTFSSQSGHWRLQGKGQKLAVLGHSYLTLPLLAHAFGYMPWSKLGSTEDIPKGAALQWARWCRHPDYLLGDTTLPLERYREFRAPVLAYSFDDDAWGTARSVDAMMRAYPSLERRHVVPQKVGLDRIGHFGFFRPEAARIWDEVASWCDARAAEPRPAAGRSQSMEYAHGAAISPGQHAVTDLTASA